MIQKQNHIYRKFFGLITLIFVFGFLTVNKVKAQAVMGAKELAMGNAVTALPGSGWSVFKNPAMMDGDSYSASFYGVRYFGLSEVSDMAFSMNYPLESGVVGVGLHRFGFDLFNENRIRIGYKNEVSGFHYGAVINYSHVNQGIVGGSAGAFGVDVGLAVAISSDLWMGVKASNINRPTYGKRNNEELPRDLSVGFSYRFSEGAVLASEVYKDVQFPLSYRAGMELELVKSLVVRAGFTTGPRTFSVGFGYSGELFSVNVAVQRHHNRILGFSPAADFQIYW